jgi:hypothetical protein
MDFSIDWLKPRLPKAAIAGAVSGIAALLFTARFSDQMPMAEWFYNLEGTWLMPLSALNLVFHEAGHWIFGILGIRFITVAGGTIMQLVFPTACLLNFLYKQKSPAGVLFSLFWLGENFMEISWYMADAKAQALILITGMNGHEGGGHDWGNMLGWLGLTNHCVGMAQAVHWAGLTLFIFPLPCLLVFLGSRFVKIPA